VATLLATAHVRDYEFDIRTKFGTILKGLYSGEIINLGDEPHILSVVRDVTETKLAEIIIRLRLMLWEFSTTHSAIEVMQKSLDEIEQLTESRIGFYHLVDEEQGALTLQAWSTHTKAEFCRAEGEGMHYPINKAGVWVDCIRQRRPVIHNDYASLPDRKGMPPGHAEVIRELVVPTMREGRVVSVLGVGNKPSNYEEKDIELVAYVADVVWNIVEQKQDDEEIRRLNSRLEHLSMTDELTGLSNRRAFFLIGNEEIKKAQRYKTPLSLMILDIDKFKNINDTFGHDAGDAALQCLARTLQSKSREVDVIARLGGEEFGILLPNTKASDAVVLAERFRSAIEGEECLIPDGRSARITASFGVATYRDEIANLDMLLQKADVAMYQAKNEGRNRVVFQG
jgi:diguanylate cyclase (GGDEF)-like protein